MIPRIIHFCWFGSSDMPLDMVDNIKKWRLLLPDYEFYKWSEDNFSIDNAPEYVRTSYMQKKYAFVSDYVRLYVIYEYGGIYLDTDVIVKNDFARFLNNGFFSSIEYHHDIVDALRIRDVSLNKDATRKVDIDHVKGIGIQSAIFGAEKKHSYIKDCMTFYNLLKFKNENSYNSIILPDILALCAEKYGFKYVENRQNLDNGIVIYEQEYFTGFKNCTNRSIAVHYAHNSWSNKTCLQIIYGMFSRNMVLKRLAHFKFFNVFYKFIRSKIWFE